MKTDITKLGVKTKWQDLTEGMIIAGAGTSKAFNTGEWSTAKPVLSWHFSLTFGAESVSING